MSKKYGSTQSDLATALDLLREARDAVTDDTREEINTFIQRMEDPIVKVIHDEDPLNPRVDYDHVDVMFCKHDRYALGDEGAEDPIEEVEIYDLGGYEVTGDKLGEIMESLGALCDHLQADEHLRIGDADYDTAESAYHEIENDIRCQNCVRVEHRLRPDIAICLPLGLYDHSGITIFRGTRSPFDSAGWDSGQVGWQYMTKEAVDEEFGGDLEKAEKYMDAVLAEYDSYLRGNCWGFTIETRSGEEIDSCWGFLGNDDEVLERMLDHVEDEYREALKDAWERRF